MDMKRIDGLEGLFIVKPLVELLRMHFPPAEAGAFLSFSAMKVMYH